jgi:protein-S-isoprenylcysteine O-methyltransferase Ste14
VTVSVWGFVALGYSIASRLAYVLYVGVALRRQERSRSVGFQRFRRVASLMMTNDGLAFVAACTLSWGTLPVAWPRGVMIVSGILLMIVGVGTKWWARATLGGDAYYWANFFDDTDAVTPTRAGPYRYLRNPMYTVGYLHAYGLAVATASLPGVVAALFAQAAILAFHRLVEKPHFDRYRDATPARVVER